MSKRLAGIALLLTMFAAAAQGETPGHAGRIDTEQRVVRLFNSAWELFRPQCREQTLFDLNYLTHDLRSERTGLGLRFSPSTHVTIDIELDPFTYDRNLIGPMYDPGIGATTVALRFSF